MEPKQRQKERPDPRDPLTPLLPTEVEDLVDPLAPELAIDPKPGVDSLPYERLAGAGFERLCYELLVAEGHAPRFFGRNGQRDYGVDIVVDGDGGTDVYQCKNKSRVPKWGELRDAVTKFESDWLGTAGLPTPKSFVYCCPQPLDDLKLQEEWTRFQEAFRGRTGVVIQSWGRNALDSRLQKLPDLVAGLFSGSHAEHFCGQDGWRDDPWTRVRRDRSRHRPIEQFLQQHAAGTIYVNQEEVQGFADALSEPAVLVIRGLPGAGKTVTGLALACRLTKPRRRIYYATLKDFGRDGGLQPLWQSVRRRTSLPALFVLDDCHLNPEATGTLAERLGPELREAQGKTRLLLILRGLPGTGGGEDDDTPDWLIALIQDGRVRDLRIDEGRTRAVTEQLRPELVGLSKQRLARLHGQSGGDLVVVREILSAVASPRDLDEISLERLYKPLRSRYFGERGNKRPLPNIRRLACLAQFDLLPLASYPDNRLDPEEAALADPLMVRSSATPRYQFLHSSLAELMTHALLALEVPQARRAEALIRTTVETLRDYLDYLACGPDADELPPTLKVLLGTRLKLAEDIDQARIKVEILGDADTQARIEAALEDYTFSFLRICLTILPTGHPARTRYLEMVTRRFRILFDRGPSGSDAAGLVTLGSGLHTLRRHAPHRLQDVLDEHGTEGFLDLIATKGTLVELFRILECTTPDFRQALLAQLQPDMAAELVHQTIAAGRSIGTLNLVMRELGNTDPDLLGRLEQRIGADRFLSLIAANGTLFELFRILQYATPDFRQALLAQLQPDIAEKLVDRTIAAGRFIGTLHLAMRELGNTDPDLLGCLEQRIGADRFLSLIAANGTLFELFRILQYATPDFRGELLAQLQPDMAAELVDRTIAAGRSIGTLDLAMRELGTTDPDLLGRLEQRIGTDRFLSLVATNGTLVELFQILRRATPDFRGALLARLQPATAAELVDRTIDAGRPIESLHYRLRGFCRPAGHREGIQAKVGIDGWWRLLAGVGTLHSLATLSGAMSDRFRGELVATSTRLTAPEWRGIINRSLFWKTCDFVNREFPDYPVATQATFQQALAESAESLAAKATWFELNPCVLATASGSAVDEILRAALRTRAAALRPDELPGLDFHAAVNGLAFAWRERPDLRPALAARLWDILLGPAAWPRQKGEVAALRLVLVLARSRTIPTDDAQQLLTDLRAFLDQAVCADMHTLPLFLLLWNMAALHYERGGGTFEGALSPPLIQVLMAELRRRVSPKGANKEKVHQLALGGLLHLLAPRQAKALREVLAPLTRLHTWLYPEALESGFVPALFALEGLALARPVEPIFTPQVCSDLRAKSEEYQEVGPAIQYLRRRVEHDGNRPVG